MQQLKEERLQLNRQIGSQQFRSRQQQQRSFVFFMFTDSQDKVHPIKMEIPYEWYYC